MCHIAAAIRMQRNGAVMSSVQCYVCLKPARLCHHLCVCVLESMFVLHLLFFPPAK